MSARTDAAQAKREALQAELENGIGTLVTSEEWQRYLTVQAKFHRYSFGNTLLIMLQRPDATRVMGFGSRDKVTGKPKSGWLKMGRCVKGPVTEEDGSITKQHGIMIWVPNKRMVEVTDASGVVKRRPDGKPVKREKLTGYGVGYVYDVSQTEGEPLPEPVAILNGADDDDVFGQLSKVAGTLGFTVELVAHLGSRNGDTSYNPDVIRVNQDRPPQQRVKTLAHELGHAIIPWHREVFLAGKYEQNRPRMELQAESVAFVVLGSLGIDAGAYSFGYVAHWAGARDGDDMDKIREWIRASGEAIQKAAKIIITTLEDQQSGQEQAS
jgi:hypothetical protein